MVLISKAPWNKGKTEQMKETWEMITDPLKYVVGTKGLTALKPEGTNCTDASVEKYDLDLSKVKSAEVKSATPSKDIKWSKYPKKA